MRSHYHVLGIAHDARAADIRAAYARLVKRHHPDAIRDTPLPQRFHDIQRAYRCLMDDTRRREHDRAIAAGERLHFIRQQNIRRGLRRYDRHRRAVVAGRRPGWRSMLVILVGATIAVRVSIALVG